MLPSYRRLALISALSLPVLGTTGCCTMFELFCGPDRSEWVSVDYSTPNLSLATFLEALRRDDSRIIYRCLSEGFKDDYGIPSAALFAVGWEKVKEEVTGIHLLAGAEVTGPERIRGFLRNGRRVRFELERAGYRFEIILDEVGAWEVMWSDEDFELQPYGEYVSDLREHLGLRSMGDGLYRVATEVKEADLGIEGIRPDQIQRAGIVREWKLSGLRQLDG